MQKNSLPPIYGFTLLRNGVKYDYSFKECLRSLANITRCTYLALGASDDGTEKAVEGFEFLRKIPTVWDESLKEGAIILSQQTNIALHEAQKNHRHETGAWGIYLQCDEVLHHEDYALIIEDIKKAEAQGCDVMRFRYLHFWLDHQHIAINKKWYPQEIRAIKLDSNIESWGDAQSFKNYHKAYESEARVFHYGHVREADSYKNKKNDILKLYHTAEKMNKYKRRERRYDKQTECLYFLGDHPREMKERILRFGDIWQSEAVENIYILGSPLLFTESMKTKINAKNIHWVKSLREVPKADRKKTIIFAPNFFHKLFYKSNMPSQMRSKLARAWSNDFILMLKLSEKGIGLKATI